MDPVIFAIYGVFAATFAVWSGYVARTKGRRVWLWVLLGAVFHVFAVTIAMQLPRRGPLY